MGPGYDLYFDHAADECYSDDLYLMERRLDRRGIMCVDTNRPGGVGSTPGPAQEGWS